MMGLCNLLFVKSNGITISAYRNYDQLSLHLYIQYFCDVNIMLTITSLVGLFHKPPYVSEADGF